MVRILYTILAVSIMSVAQGEDVCNIEHRTIVREEEMVLPSHPVIFEIGNSHINEQLIEAGSREHLREDWGSAPVRLTSSNALSHGIKETTLSEYLDMMQEESESPGVCRSANETWYLFGNNESQEPFKSLAAMYELPASTFRYEEKEATAPELQDPTVVIGLGRQNSGLSFHFHGPGFSQAIIGRKRWFLYKPNTQPRLGFEAMVNVTLAEWSQSEDFGSCASLDGPTNAVDFFFQCTIDADRGEILYFPSNWYHATLNEAPYTLFVSVFL